MKTAVRDLKPGDVLDSDAVVLHLYPAQRPDGKASVVLGRFGDRAYDDRVSVVEWASEASVEVVRPDLTPAQQHADLFALYASRYLTLHNSADAGPLMSPTDAAELTYALYPPPPPALEELADALQALVDGAAPGPTTNAARALLARLPPRT